MIQLWDGKNKWELVDGPKAHEATYLKLDCSKAHAKLNWQPRWDLSQALKATVAWYRAYHNQEDMREVTLRQIAEYMTN